MVPIMPQPALPIPCPQPIFFQYYPSQQQQAGPVQFVTTQPMGTPCGLPPLPPPLAPLILKGEIPSHLPAPHLHVAPTNPGLAKKPSGCITVRRRMFFFCVLQIRMFVLFCFSSKLNTLYKIVFEELYSSLFAPFFFWSFLVILK